MWHAEFVQRFQPWALLSDEQREDFFTGDEYLPLPATHAERIGVLQGTAAREFIARALSGVAGYSAAAASKFAKNESISLSEVWGDPQKIQEIREWLYERGLKYSTPVYLLYDDVVVATEWKIVITYWDAFAWSVGVEMLAIDASRSWACSFHHEDVITFSAL